MVENDVPLLSFEEIKKSLESQINTGYICSIDTLKLGYYPYRDTKNRKIFWLFPAWYLTGTCTYTETIHDGSTVTVPGELEAVVQAQTGELYDLRIVDNPRSGASAIIAWKDLESSK